MNPFPYMPLYPRDLMADPHVRAMRLDEFGAYIRLLTVAWDEEPVGTLPNDEETLAAYAGVPLALWQRMCVRVLRPFKISEDGLRLEQRRMIEEFAAISKKAVSVSTVRRQAAQARWAKQKDCTSNANAFQVQSTSNAIQNQNQNIPPKAPHAVAWSAGAGWEGIGNDLKAEWAIAYPACDLDRQLAAMHSWLKANPLKARKSNWTRFITNWLGKEQDRGGDLRTPRPVHAQAPRRGVVAAAQPGGWEL